MTTMYRGDGSALEMIGTLGETRLAKDDTGEMVQIFVGEDLYVTPDEGLRSTLADLKDQIREEESNGDELRASTRDARIAHRETLERLVKLDPSLAHIEKYLLGEFTHFAFVDSYRMHVKTMEEALADPEYGRDGAFRLLTMRGKVRRGQSPTWEVNTYHDGSGGSSRVVPCKSEEDALEVIKGVISSKIEEGLFSYIARADEFGVEVPEELRSNDLGRRLLVAEANELEDRQRLEKSSACLDEIREECHD